MRRREIRDFSSVGQGTNPNDKVPTVLVRDVLEHPVGDGDASVCHAADGRDAGGQDLPGYVSPSVPDRDPNRDDGDRLPEPVLCADIGHGSTTAVGQRDGEGHETCAHALVGHKAGESEAERFGVGGRW